VILISVALQADQYHRLALPADVGRHEIVRPTTAYQTTRPMERGN